jgi:5-methylcytosine-specific restriction endonuclease McrA
MDERTCSHSGCTRTDVVGYDELCRKHYQRKRTTGRLELAERLKLACAVGTCGEPTKSLGLCSTHYARQLKTGSARPSEPVRKLRELGSSKVCSACGINKPLNNFAPDNRHRDGRQARCRECVRAYQKRYRRDSRERYLELRQQEYERNRDQILAFRAAYRKANGDRLRQEAREHRAALTREELEAYREKHRLRSAEYRLKNPDLCNERIRRWGKANPDKKSEYVNRRRAWKHGNAAPETFTRTEIGDRDDWTCGICGLPVDKTLRFPDRQSPSLDHVIPLSLGGHHTQANSRIAHWICNVRRGADRKRGEAA